MIKTKIGKSSRIRQGDIYKSIEYLEYIKEKKGVLEISKIIYPYVIVLTQDCDLKQDFVNRKEKKVKPEKTQDKYLISVLVAPLFNVEHFKKGEHFSEIELHMRDDIPWDQTEGKKIKKNELPRYHYLKFPPELEIVDSIIDFKHFFSINIKSLNKIRRKNFVCSVAELFREEISDRFAFYLARIGLPELKPKEGQMNTIKELPPQIA